MNQIHGRLRIRTAVYSGIFPQKPWSYKILLVVLQLQFAISLITVYIICSWYQQRQIIFIHVSTPCPAVPVKLLNPDEDCAIFVIGIP